MKIPEQLEYEIQTILPKLEGWCKPEKAVRMARYIVEEAIPVAIEIGVFGGSSLIPIGMAMKYVPGGVVIGIDPWHKDSALEGQNDKANDEWWGKISTPSPCPACKRDAPEIEKIHQGFINKLYELSIQNIVVTIRATSDQVSKIIRRDPIGFLHIDGNHSELASVRDVDTWFPKLAIGGILVFDDTDWPTTKKAVEIVSEHSEDLGSEGTAAFFRKTSPLTLE